MHLAESGYLEEVEDTRRGRSKHEAEGDQREANEELLKQVDAHFLASFWAEPAQMASIGLLFKGIGEQSK